ncbi:hypothetical protein [Thauera aromatica]|uniref:Uncharacterized protein n=1 Tax=Thauera aromatica K172 TaxID=44139 RepID=A0A2R4BNU5_THAAR|nr:hypothetical protein [Thauera aromatica]AVR89017.1 hypothetical protein Tharo_2114 [Thauera aromatica K172]
MRLNGSALNARPLNGASRLAVFGAAEAIAGFDASLEGLRTVRASGNAPMQVQAGLLGSAQRFASLDAPIRVQAELAQTVYRSGRGAFTITHTGILYFERTVLGFGGAGIFLHAAGHVGVVFIDGEAQIRPLIAEVDGTRARRSSATASMALMGDLSASAIRRGAAQAPNDLAITAELDPAHIHEGVRHLTAGGSPVVEVRVTDEGMRRQTLLGSATVDFHAIGAGRLSKPTMAGGAVQTLTLDADFRVYRRWTGAAVVQGATDLAGEVFVRGGGQAAVQIIPACTGYVYRRTASGAAASALDAQINALRAKVGGASAAVEVAAGAAGALRRTGRGKLVIEVPVTPIGQASAVRGGQGALLLHAEGGLSGEVLIPGDAEAVLLVTLEGAGYVYRRTASASAALDVALELAANRRRTAEAAPSIQIIAEANGVRGAALSGDAEMVLLAPSEGYTNIYGEDPSEQQFYRPTDLRSLQRWDALREFRRTQ